jgi:hypothetical protein
MFIENTLKIFISNGGKIAEYEGKIGTIFFPCGNKKALEESFFYCPTKTKQ